MHNKAEVLKMLTQQLEDARDRVKDLKRQIKFVKKTRETLKSEPPSSDPMENMWRAYARKIGLEKMLGSVGTVSNPQPRRTTATQKRNINSRNSSTDSSADSLGYFTPAFIDTVSESGSRRNDSHSSSSGDFGSSHSSSCSSSSDSGGGCDY